MCANFWDFGENDPLIGKIFSVETTKKAKRVGRIVMRELCQSV
jgi:hypothetical protein